MLNLQQSMQNQNQFPKQTMQNQNLCLFQHVLVLKIKERMLDYFNVHQSKAASAVIVIFSTILSFFVHAGKS